MLVGLLGHEHNHPQAFPKAEVSSFPLHRFTCIILSIIGIVICIKYPVIMIV